MSRTYKVASFDQAEAHINRAMNSINAVQNQVANAERRAKNAAREEVKKRAKKIQKDLKILENNLNYQMAEISEEVRQNYIAHKIALENQANEFNQQLSTLQDWTQTSLNNLASDMNQKFGEQQNQIDACVKNIQNIYDREKDLTKQANDRLQDLNGLLMTFDQNNNHEKYAEGRYRQLIRRFEDINGSNVPSQSVIMGAISITNDIFDLEEEIAKEKLVFESVYNQTLSIAKELLEIMKNNRTNLYFTNENGQKLEDEDGNHIQIEVNFWTDNQYSVLEKQAQQIHTELIKKEQNPELNRELLLQLQQQLHEIKIEQERLVLTACEKGILSTNRGEIAEDILEAFEQQGFWLKESEDSFFYEGNKEKNTQYDYREGVVINLINDIGTELTIRIVPERKKNKIHFHRNDNRDMTEQEYMELLEEVQQIIEGNEEYKMSSFKTPNVGDVRIDELADINALRRGLSNQTKSIK